MLARLARLGFAGWLTVSAGCTSWSRIGDRQPVPSRGTVQVWSAGTDLLLRDARTVGDSLVGRAPLPDTTRRAVPLMAIDSVRMQSTDMGKTLIVSSAAAIAVLLAYSSGLGGMD